MAKTGDKGGTGHPVVSHEKWISARTAFLAKEKEFTRLEGRAEPAARVRCPGKP